MHLIIHVTIDVIVLNLIGFFMYTRFNVQNFCFERTGYIYGFNMDLRTNNDYPG
jgi:hypothetical protein